MNHKLPVARVCHHAGIGGGQATAGASSVESTVGGFCQPRVLSFTCRKKNRWINLPDFDQVTPTSCHTHPAIQFMDDVEFVTTGFVSLPGIPKLLGLI